MKSINFFKYALLMAVAVVMIGFNSCKDDDDDDTTPPIFVEDGFYIKGAGTALAELEFAGMFKAAVNEADDNNERPGLYEIYVAVTGGQGFNIIQVAGQTQKTWGPGSDFAELTLEARHVEEPRLAFYRGSLAETATSFTVAEDGLYHVALDVTLGTVVLAKVEWGLIGAATPGGWDGSTQMAADFNKEKMTFVLEDVAMENADWKFRYSNGWKMFLDAPANTVSVNTNFGGTIAELVPGGGNIALSERGKYKYTLTWELGKAYVATEQKTGELDPAPVFPDAMYVTGAATAYGWATPGTNPDAIMHKIAGGPNNAGIFWKILHLEGGEGFKLSATNAEGNGWGIPNLDFSNVDVWDADGVTVTAAGGDWKIANSGMYIIVLNLRDSEVKVSITEVNVYGIGDAFGGFIEEVAANKFVVDNAAKTVTSPALPASGNIRMYVDHAWIPAWWQSEFNVFNGVIEYRADGGDQDDVPGTAGQIVTLKFDDNTGTIQ